MESLGAKGFEQAITAADTKDEVPEPLKSGALEWFASLAAPTCLRPAARFAAKEKTHGSVRKQKPAQEARDDSDIDDNVESVANGYGSLGSDKQSKDEMRMKLAGLQIQGHHRSLFKGRVVSEGECEGVPYGQDCQYTEWARLLKKSGILSSLVLLATRDYDRVKDHFVTLVREYNEKGHHGTHRR